MSGRGGRVKSTCAAVCVCICVCARPAQQFVIIEELVAIQCDPLQHRSIHSPGSSADPFLRAKCCCAGKTGPPEVPEKEPFNPLYLFAAYKALRAKPISHYCLLHSQYFLKLRPQQELSLS